MNQVAWDKYVNASNAYIAKLERRLKQMSSQNSDFQRRITNLQKNLKVADTGVDVVSYVATRSHSNITNTELVHRTGTHTQKT